jgi:hypothetical protein
MIEKPAGETGHEERVMDRSNRHKGLDDDELRALLRRGDPAGDGHDPAPGEIAAWRQTMLATARERLPGRYRYLWQGALATAGLALLVVLIIPFLRPSSELSIAPVVADLGEPVVADPVPSPLPGTGAPTASDTALPGSTEANPARWDEAGAPTFAGESGPDRPTVTAAVDPVDIIEPTLSPDEIPAQVGDAALATAVARPARTIQFTAPGGTRIIWRLDPGFSLPQEGEKT